MRYYCTIGGRPLPILKQMVSIAALTALTGVLGQSAVKAQNSPLVGTLTRMPGHTDFTLRIRNISNHRTAVCLYRWLYELRLFDEHGHKLTNEKSFLAASKLKPPRPADYIILAPRQSVSRSLAPIVQGKYGVFPAAAKRADCTWRSLYRDWMQKHVPSALTRSGIRLRYLKATELMQWK